MIKDPHEHISAYFDDTLTAEQLQLLNDWIKSSPGNARIFAQAALLHDKLRDLSSAANQSTPVHIPATPSSTAWFSDFTPKPFMWSTSAAVALAILLICSVWLGLGQPTASAAYRELDRIIENSLQSNNRTYEIIVESISTPLKQGKRSSAEEKTRPEKPPLSNAMLYVGENNRFVLIRKAIDGTPFITGSNGQQSWAVNNKGPVRVSDDINHFARDLPGHETSIPLNNLHEGLERLRAAYQVDLSSVGPEEFETKNGETPRMLIAVKKPKERGPQRVEIVYESQSGRILNMRFIQMPYGPDRLDLRLNLLDETELPNSFFEHASHHQFDRSIEWEK